MEGESGVIKLPKDCIIFSPAGCKGQSMVHITTKG